MTSKARLILSNPRRYVPLAARLVATSPLRLLSRLLSRAPFFLQEQMDIHPRSAWHDPHFAARYGGFNTPGDATPRRITNPDPWDLVRRDMLVLLLRSITERGIAGDLAELGVYRGATARLIHHYAPDRVLHLFDTFTGFDARDISAERQCTGRAESTEHYGDTSVAQALKRIAPLNDNIRVHRGFFPESVPAELHDSRFALVHLDADLFEPISAGLDFFYERTSPGGFIVVHDYNAWPGPREAVDAFFRDRPEMPVPMPDKNGSVVIPKQ